MSTTDDAWPTIRVLSLGAGVQSTTLLLMSLEGILPKVDCAIFADTGWEPQRVYDHLDLITAQAAGEIPVLRVSKGNLRYDITDPAHRYASIPYFVRNPPYNVREPVRWEPCDHAGHDTDEDPDDWPCAPDDRSPIEWADRPATLAEREGMGRRQCTSEYKLTPIRRKVRELLGASPPDFRRVPRGRVAEQWVGFSTDEVGRVSDKFSVLYMATRYPLIELGMDRKACERWLHSRGWTSVAKSACIGCPLHGNRQWRDLRDNHPAEWADAVALDAAIRKGGSHAMPLRGEAFLHRSRVPLDQAPIDRVTSAEWASRQVDVFDVIADADEEGDPDGCSPYGCRSGAPVSAGSDTA